MIGQGVSQEDQRSYRTIKIGLSIVLIIIIIISSSLLFLNSSVNIPNRQLPSFDWGGYAVVSDYKNPQPIVSGVNGSWTVPKVKISRGNTFSAAWIGIGGLLDETLIQVGTEQDSVGGSEVYSSWFEVLPDYSRTITAMNISDGDKISASIRLLDPNTNGWLIQLKDITTGETFEKNLFYNSSMLSAEWVVERPTLNNRISTLADFGRLTFTNSYAIIENRFGTIGSFPYYMIVMNNRMNTTLVTVSPLASNNSGFTVDYLPSSTTTIMLVNGLKYEMIDAPLSLSYCGSSFRIHYPSINLGFFLPYNPNDLFKTYID